MGSSWIPGPHALSYFFLFCSAWRPRSELTPLKGAAAATRMPRIYAETPAETPAEPKPDCKAVPHTHLTAESAFIPRLDTAARLKSKSYIPCLSYTTNSHHCHVPLGVFQIRISNCPLGQASV